MATLVLATAGAAVGGALRPAGVGLLGTTLTGAALGRAVGAMAGRYIDEALFGASGQSRIVENTGARLSDLQVTSSSEGTAIPRIYGRARLGGQIIWATHFEEEVVREQSGGSSGKGLGGSGGTTTVTTSTTIAPTTPITRPILPPTIPSTAPTIPVIRPTIASINPMITPPCAFAICPSLRSWG